MEFIEYHVADTLRINFYVVDWACNILLDWDHSIISTKSVLVAESPARKITEEGETEEYTDTFIHTGFTMSEDDRVGVRTTITRFKMSHRKPDDICGYQGHTDLVWHTGDDAPIIARVLFYFHEDFAESAVITIDRVSLAQLYFESPWCESDDQHRIVRFINSLGPTCTIHKKIPNQHIPEYEEKWG